ncbi:MAG TPA: VTT domain-containing protein, partial [Nitrospirota bacterium]|nr:VTT domain-containing protein [Nitrospirota bacterium]
FFISTVEANRHWAYWLLCAAMIIEGELFLATAGMMVRLHAFHFLDSFLFALCGVLLGDMLWYFAGRQLRSRYPRQRISTVVIRRVKRYLPDIESNPFHVIFLSKFLYGLNHSTLVVLGFLKVPFGHFMRIQFISSFIWSLLFLTIGYLFGSVAVMFTQRLRHFMVLAFMLLAVIAILVYIIGRLIEKAEQKHQEL